MDNEKKIGNLLNDIYYFCEDLSIEIIEKIIFKATKFDNLTYIIFNLLIKKFDEISNESKQLLIKILDSKFNMNNFDLIEIIKLPEDYIKKILENLSKFQDNLDSISYSFCTNFTNFPQSFRERLLPILLKSPSRSCSHQASYCVRENPNILSESCVQEILNLLNIKDREELLESKRVNNIFKNLLEKVDEDLKDNLTYNYLKISTYNVDDIISKIIGEYFSKNKYKSLIYELIEKFNSIDFIIQSLRSEYYNNKNFDIELIEKILSIREKEWNINSCLKLQISDFTNSNDDIGDLLYILSYNNPYKYISYKLKKDFDKIPINIIQENILLCIESKNIPYEIYEAIDEYFCDFSNEFRNNLIINWFKNTDYWTPIIDILNKYSNIIEKDIKEKILSEIIINSDVRKLSGYIKDIEPILLKNFEDFSEKLKEDFLISLSKSKYATSLIIKLINNFENSIKPNIISQVILEQLKFNKNNRFLIVFLLKKYSFEQEDIKRKIFNTIISRKQNNKYLSYRLLNLFSNIDENFREELFINLSTYKECAHILLIILYKKFYLIPLNIRNDFLKYIIEANITSKSLVGIIYKYYDDIPEEIRNSILINLFSCPYYKENIIHFIQNNKDKVNKKVLDLIKL
ncbi:MAG: hypothetical protein U0354_07425 [Candidatus Sericytochromatia bacterium]